MDSILVTGGAGFIGGSFVRQWFAGRLDLPLTAAGAGTLVNLDKLTYAGNLDSLASVAGQPRYHFVQGDICDRPLIARLLAEHRPRAVVNFAAESHVDRSIENPRSFIETNVLGTFELLEASLAYWKGLPADEKAAFRFLHVSTDEVYGTLGPEGKFTEQNPYAPNSPYSASKASADHFVRAYLHTYGLPVLTTICVNNYGPFQFPEKLLPLVISNALSGKPLPIYGDGKQVRDWLFVEDHCRAIARVLQKGTLGQKYHVSADCDRPNIEVVRKVCGLIDKLKPGLPHGPCEKLITYVTDRPGHDRRYALEASRIQTELGWKPQVTFDTGLEQTVRWYLENTEWTGRVMSGAYRGQRLGLSHA